MGLPTGGCLHAQLMRQLCSGFGHGHGLVQRLEVEQHAAGAWGCWGCWGCWGWRWESTGMVFFHVFPSKDCVFPNKNGLFAVKMLIFPRKMVIIINGYSLVNCYLTMENHNFYWENQYFDWAIFNSDVTNCQRVDWEFRSDTLNSWKFRMDCRYYTWVSLLKKNWKLGTHLGTFPTIFGSQKDPKRTTKLSPQNAPTLGRPILLWPVPPGTARAASRRGGRPGRPWARDAAAPSPPRRTRSRSRSWLSNNHHHTMIMRIIPLE